MKIRSSWQHRTTIFGFIQVTLGVLATSIDLFNPIALKWIILVNGLLTAWLGLYNAAKARASGS